MNKSFSFTPLCRASAGVLCPALVKVLHEPHQREQGTVKGKIRDLQRGPLKKKKKSQAF